MWDSDKMASFCRVTEEEVDKKGSGLAVGLFVADWRKRRIWSQKKIYN